MKQTTKYIVIPCLIGLAVIGFLSPPASFVRLALAAGTTDPYEQCILYIEVYQWDNISSEFDLMGNVTFAAYSSGYDVNVYPGLPIRFFIKTGINSKFADDSPNAVAKTRVYITITGELSRTLCTTDNCTGDVDPFGNQTLKAVWSHYYWSPSGGKPYAGNTYSVLFEYYAYYDPDDWTP